MSLFEVGEKVHMPGLPLVVEVLEVGPACQECLAVAPGDHPVFRFTDPVTGVDDWMHCAEFQLVPR